MLIGFTKGVTTISGEQSGIKDKQTILSLITIIIRADEQQKDTYYNKGFLLYGTRKLKSCQATNFNKMGHGKEKDEENTPNS